MKLPTFEEFWYQKLLNFYVVNLFFSETIPQINRAMVYSILQYTKARHQDKEIQYNVLAVTIHKEYSIHGFCSVADYLL